MYPKFRIDFENAKTQPNDITELLNGFFNDYGGTTAKNADDSIKAALPTAERLISLSDELQWAAFDFNKENMLILKNTCEDAIAQKKIVDKFKALLK